MINSIIKKSYFKKNNKGTALAIGTVSKNTILASHLVSKRMNIPIMLISSRRQIETKEISKGYVENFTTEDYSKFIKKLPSNKLILCRDHGGPYQGSNEEKLTKIFAMKQAKISYMSDIDNDFKVIHVDPSINPKTVNVEKKIIIEDILELIEFCYKYSQKKKKKIFFEIGTEEPSCFTGTPEELNSLVNELIFHLNKNKLPKPLYCVLQTGTRVKEFSNVGILNDLKYLNKNSDKIRKISKICKNNNMFLKQHNTDYLKEIILKKLPSLNIDAANVAPEFGYVESLCLFQILTRYNKKKLLERFLEISYKSNKWKKWLIKNSKLSDLQKSLISAHYVYADIEFKELKKEIQITLPSIIDLDELLISSIKNKIFHYMKCFNYNKCLT